jgi:hypothetical protein
MKKCIILMAVIALILALALPAMASVSNRIQKTNTTGTVNQSGGSITQQGIYNDDAAAGIFANVATNTYAQGLILNQSILNYLLSIYTDSNTILDYGHPTYSHLHTTDTAHGVQDILAQLAASGSVGTELGTALTIGSGWTSDEMATMAGSLDIGERGGVYVGTGISATVGVSMSQNSTTKPVGHKIVQSTSTTFNSLTYTIYAQGATRWVSPIVLDMTGKGRLEASHGKYLPHDSIDKNNLMLVDFYNNGFEVAMEWVGPNDGLLVAPRADGTVDATCLFGTTGGFENGFQKLSILDRNKDGQLSADELKGLCVWQDKNQDGAVDAGEMASVQDLAITSISLKEKGFVSSYVRNGKTYKMWDWWPTAMELEKVSQK